MRRYTRRTNAFSKKFENHFHTLSIYFVYYNFVRPHMSLGRKKKTPAMAAGIAKDVKSLEWIVEMIR